MQLDISRRNRIHPTEFTSNDLFFEDVPSSTCSSKETFVTNSNVDPAVKLDATLVRVQQPLRKRRVVPKVDESVDVNIRLSRRYHKGDRVKVKENTAALGPLGPRSRRTGTIRELTDTGYKIQLDISRRNMVHPTEFTSNDIFFEDPPKTNADLAARLGGTLVKIHPPVPENPYGAAEDPISEPRRLAPVTPAYEGTRAIDTHQGTDHATLLTMSAMFLLVMFLFRRWAAKNVS